MQGASYVIGVMSGTSLDGVDLVYVKFTYQNGKYQYQITHTESYSYTIVWKEKLTEAFYKKPEELQGLDKEYGALLGGFINSFIRKYKIDTLNLIASHGHTIFHKPNEGYTLQIGDGRTIADTTGKTVVCDFRSQDVALGGQGAPLVPIGDMLLFSEYDYCLNIGGFANISFDKNGIRRAYDICPANIVLNHYTRQIGKEYDDRGEMAEKGTINYDLLQKLEVLSVYNSKKSMGNEVVVSEFIPLIDSFDLKISDILKTYIEHFSKKIAKELQANATVLITGGGAFNGYLISRIAHFSEAHLVIPETRLIEYKEALIFALLGLLRMNNQTNCLSSVTGAKKDHSSGIIFYYD